MLVDKRIIITGATGKIGAPLIERLAPRNEIWAVARFRDRATVGRFESLGVHVVPIDLAGGSGFAGLPGDADYLVHLGASLDGGVDYDHALRVNAEATGLLLAACRTVDAALVMSTGSVYQPVSDPGYAYRESDPLGDAHTPGVPTYSISKIAQEAVARTVARMLDLPVVITRMVVAYGDDDGYPARHLDSILDGVPVEIRFDPNLYNPIHISDIADQLGAMLEAARPQATIVNWGGDEVVSAQDWCTYFGQLTGRAPTVVVREQPGTQPGVVVDVERRRAVAGKCGVSWREGMRTLVEHRVAMRTSGSPAPRAAAR